MDGSRLSPIPSSRFPEANIGGAEEGGGQVQFLQSPKGEDEEEEDEDASALDQQSSTARLRRCGCTRRRRLDAAKLAAQRCN